LQLVAPRVSAFHDHDDVVQKAREGEQNRFSRRQAVVDHDEIELVGRIGDDVAQPVEYLPVVASDGRKPQEFDPAPWSLDDTISEICTPAVLGVSMSDRARCVLLVGIADHQEHTRAFGAGTNRKIKRDNRPDIRAARRRGDKCHVGALRAASRPQNARQPMHRRRLR
jgi:hypothetical protein